MGELWQLGALEIAAAIRNRETTSREVLDALVERVDAVNGQLNAVVALLGDEAAKAAEAADRAVLDGEQLGPLHGVPITVKENIDVAGWPTTQGVPALAEATAPIDAPIVERMRAAGAIPFARTNLPDFGLARAHRLVAPRAHPQPVAPRCHGGRVERRRGERARQRDDTAGPRQRPRRLAAQPRPLLRHRLDQAVDRRGSGRVGAASRGLPDHVPAHGGARRDGASRRRPPRRPPRRRRVARPRPIEPAGHARRARSRSSACGSRCSPSHPAGPPIPASPAAIQRTADALADAGHDVAEASPPSYARSLELWAELLLPDVRAVRPLFDELMSDDARAFLDFADIYLPGDRDRRLVDAVHRASRGGEGLGSVLRVVGRPAHPDLDATTVRPRGRRRLVRRGRWRRSS